MHYRGSICLKWVCHSGPLTEWPKRLLVLSRVQDKRRLCDRSKLLCKSLCHWTIWSSRFTGAYSVSGRERCCPEPVAGPYRWITVQAPRILEPGPAPITDHYSPFKKQLLASNWALVETEHSTVAHQVTKQPELAIMNWVLSDSPNYKVECAQQHSIMKWKW